MLTAVLALNTLFSPQKFENNGLNTGFSSPITEVHFRYGGVYLAATALGNAFTLLSCLQIVISWLEMADALYVLRMLARRKQLKQFKVRIRVLTGISLVFLAIAAFLRAIVMLSALLILLIIGYLVLLVRGQRAFLTVLKEISANVVDLSRRAIVLVTYCARAHLILLGLIIVLLPVTILVTQVTDKYIAPGEFYYPFAIRDLLFMVNSCLLITNTTYAWFLLNAIITRTKTQRGAGTGEVTGRITYSTKLAAKMKNRAKLNKEIPSI